MTHLRQRARQLRKTMTLEEIKLWLQLKHLNVKGFHFRRQVPLDGYILDFAEFGLKLIIEVDGAQHNEPDASIRDARRDAHFANAGFKVIRFWNFQINQEMDGVMDHILSLLREPPPALNAPPPP